ncbi:hypothetical protein BH09SUM1_BH09SUM1_14540 [soil metagenome]
MRRSSQSILAAAGCILLSLAHTGIAAQNTRPKVTWHWHLHQPIYWNDQLRTGAVDRYEYAWDSIQQKNGGQTHPLNNLSSGEDGVFSKADRVAAYQYRMKDSLQTIGSYTNSGVAVSYSGALMENVISLAGANQLGYTSAWKTSLDTANNWTTTGGFKRLEFTNFSFHHGLVGLLDNQTVYMELRLQQEITKREFGQDAVSKGFFPTEMTFAERLIPTLKQLGIEWSIVSGEHISRACPDFPVVYGSGGINCDPPNKADQINPNGVEFIRTSTDRGCSATNANPLSYQPAYAKWVNPDTGVEDKIVVVPADQGFSWRDGYGCIDAGFLPPLEARNDPAHPSLVLLSHDGDNAFGGGNSYYNECVQNLAANANSKGNEVTSIQQYLSQFPADTSKTIHVENGGWINADGDFGSPSYINWNYPILNSSGQIDPANGWHEKPREMAIFTETLNRILTAQQISAHTPDFAKILTPDAGTHAVDRAWHYYLGSLDSGNVYYGDALDLEVKGTIGCNEAFEHVDPIIGDASADATPPTIWYPQRQPWNPGSTNFGVQYQYHQIVNNGDFYVWTFISDVSGPATATIKYRLDNDGENPLASNQNETYAGGSEVGEWQTLPMTRRAFPANNIYNKPNLDYFELPTHIADQYSVQLTGFRSTLMDYYIEATDSKNNTSRSPIEHVYIGDGQGATGGGGTRVTITPTIPVRGQSATITYDATGTALDTASAVYLHIGKNGFASVVTPRPALTSSGAKMWTVNYTVPSDATVVDFAFTTTATGTNGTWDNNGGLGVDWHYNTTAGTGTPTPSLSPTPTPSPTPTGVAATSPFTMDGVIDSGTCAIAGGLYVKESQGWLYVATDGATPADAFIYVSSDPTVLKAANWAKTGQVGTWTYFLAQEGSNNYASWFNAAGTAVADDTASFVHARNGSTGTMEGAIKKSLIGGETAYAALGIFGTADGGALTAQSPESRDSDANINANEFKTVVTGTDPCAVGTSPPTATPTPTPAITPTPDPGTQPTIIIGAGPGIGTTAGQTFAQELQDWTRGDVRALDAHDDTYQLDGQNASRDLLAFYTRDDAANGSYFMRADFLDLAFGAESAGVDVIVLMDFGTPTEGQTAWPEFADVNTDHQWEVAIVVDETGVWRVYDKNFAILTSDSANTTLWKGAYFRSDLDAVEFGIARSVLTGQGWDGTSPISLQVGTVKDGTNITDANGFGNVSNLTDSMPDPDRGFSDGVVNGAFLSTATAQSARYAFVLHGNQAISNADYLQGLIYSDVVKTPGGNPTGFHRALDTARIFGVPPNIHVSATLLAGCLWADKLGVVNPQDGPNFVQSIARFIDGNAANGEGEVVRGVYSEHIMPFFEGQVNQDSIALNNDYLTRVLGASAPTATSTFWIPERVVRGSTFADLTATGFHYTILDQINHLRSWFGSTAENAGKNKINRINGVNCFMINDAQDRFKFANTDGGLYLDTRKDLIDLALDADPEKLILIFDDWEAYAGRSFLSFDVGNDNPDNFNTNIRWIANHPWIEVVTLEDIASRGWTPIDRGTDLTLPFETYDYLDWSTEGSYENWYKGSAIEENFSAYQPWIRQDLDIRGAKPFGAVTTYLNSASGPRGGAGTIAEDVRAQVFGAPANDLQKLARIAYSTAIFETGWHAEQGVNRCGDGTYCNPDTQFDNTADFAKQLQFMNLRQGGGIYATAAEWAANPGTGVTAQAIDIDHDGENEFVLKNDRVFAVFENDGGRLIAAFARNVETGHAVSLIGNLIGFPDGEDERESTVAATSKRTSGLVDFYATGVNASYVNDIYSVATGVGSLTLTSSDGKITKKVALLTGSPTLHVTYHIDPSIDHLYIRSGYSVDLLSLLEYGSRYFANTERTNTVEQVNVNTGARIRIEDNSTAPGWTYNFVADSGITNTTNNQAMTHVVEMDATANDIIFNMTLMADGAPPAMTADIIEVLTGRQPNPGGLDQNGDTKLDAADVKTAVGP